MCPGEIISATVTQRSGPTPAVLLIQFPGAPLQQSYAPGQGVPGATQPNYVTVPAGAHEAVITINSLFGAAIVTHASVERVGPGCGVNS